MRFTDSDQGTYPAITNYDFTGNCATRSINNRSFRWEDVTKRAIYEYQDVTVSGEFESNNYASLHTITNPTGVNYITTGNKDSTSYPGWTISGAYSLWVGISGICIPSGQLTGLTSSLIGHPIQGLESIALYSYTGTPVIFSNTYPTGEGAILPNNAHQVYALSKAIKTSTGELVKVYPRGWAGGQIVAWYDYDAETWGLSEPSGSFLVSATGYTEIKYRFTTSNYPAADPTGFDLYFKLQSTGGCVLVDDLHIDAVMKKNAFVENIVPSGYVIEITPDLGWHNMMDMFTTDDGVINPYIQTLGPFSIEAGNLEDNLDNTVTATVDETQFRTAINNRYSKYLWRAIALSSAGEFGEAGLPQRFDYVGSDIDNTFSVTSISDDDTGTIKTIIGTKSSRSSIYLFDLADHPLITYPTATSWKLVYFMSKPTETIKLYAVDLGGATSATKYLSLSMPVLDQANLPIWNPFDEHGLLMDLDRLPGESNYDYSVRIKDVMSNKGNATFAGVVNGGTRELGLFKIKDAITIAVKKDSNSLPIATRLDLEVGSTYLKIRSVNMLKDEILLVDPVYGTITLSEHPYEFPEYCELYNGKPILDKNIVWDPLNEEFGTDIRLKITDKEVHGKYVRVKYQYYTRLEFAQYPTLGQLVDAINLCVDNGNVQYVAATISQLLSGNENCLGLLIGNSTLLPSDTYVIPWAPFFLKRISDKTFREYNKDQDTYRKSRFYKYVSQLKLNSRVLWGSVEADRDYWDAADSQDLSFDTIPTLMDPALSEFKTLVSGQVQRVESVQAWGKRFIGNSGEQLVNAGVTSTDFQPGVGFTSDLQPGIHYTITNLFNNTEQYFGVSTVKQDNTTVLFSGQR